MQNKTAAQIQAEIDLIRLAYRRRRRRHAHLDFRLRPTIREATPYLLTGSLITFAILFIVAIFTA